MPRPVQGNHYGAVVSGFFIVPIAAVLRTIASTSLVVARKESNSRYVARLGGSSRIIRSAGLISKPRGQETDIEMLLAAEEPPLSTPFLFGVGGSLGGKRG